MLHCTCEVHTLMAASLRIGGSNLRVFLGAASLLDLLRRPLLRAPPPTGPSLEGGSFALSLPVAALAPSPCLHTWAAGVLAGVGCTGDATAATGCPAASSSLRVSCMLRDTVASAWQAFGWVERMPISGKSLTFWRF